MSPTAALGPMTVVELSQGPIRTYRTGSGPTIVFVHGLFCNAAVWRKVVPLLEDRYTCITADWPFGSHYLPMKDSADLTPRGIAETVADTIEALELDDVTLVGNDGGTMLSQLVVAYRPERLGALVLTSGDAYENFPPRMFEYLCWLARIPGAVAAVGQSLRLPPVRRLPNAYGWLSHSRVPDDVLDHYLAPLRNRAVRRDGLKFLRSVSNRYTLDAAGRFRTFDKPALIAWCADDKFFPLEHAERLHTQFPDSRRRDIADSRTYVSEDQPEVLASLIGEFLAEIAAGHRFAASEADALTTPTPS